MEFQSIKWINIARPQSKWDEREKVTETQLKTAEAKTRNVYAHITEKSQDIRYGWIQELKGLHWESVLYFGSTFLGIGFILRQAFPQIMTKMAPKALVSHPPGSATPKEKESRSEVPANVPGKRFIVSDW